jgi:hypothetical protein
MGVLDEHWCSKCKKALDKAKDQYIESEFPNAKKKYKSNRVFFCEKCAKKEKVTVAGKKVSVWAFFQKLRHRGNPKFEVGIHCYSSGVCGTFEKSKNPRMNCANIAVTPEGQVYCKRNHPGFLTVPQEKALVETVKLEWHQEVTGNIVKALGFKDIAQALGALGQSKVSVKNVTPHTPLGKRLT